MLEHGFLKAVASEQALTSLAARVAATWLAGRHMPLVVGLSGPLGAGKTTWVRAMLRGFGYQGRVPSPTYTLLEPYELDGVELLHLDLYRLGSDEELEQIGLRDWLARASVWVFCEWPERAPRFADRCDVRIEFTLAGRDARGLGFRAQSQAGESALRAIRNLDSS
jgi:tRNA threonylcarbamoyladenosine biosynthesis protein TsaE